MARRDESLDESADEPERDGEEGPDSDAEHEHEAGAEDEDRDAEGAKDDDREEDKGAPPKTRWQKVRGILLQVALVLVALWGIGKWQARNLLPERAAAPAIALTSLDGEQLGTETAKGRKLVLYFFAPWCSVCELSSHNVRALRSGRSEDEVAVYAVGLAYESDADLREFARSHELNVPVLKGTETTQRDYRIDSFPTVYIIDEDSKVQDRVVGYTTELGLRLRAL